MKKLFIGLFICVVLVSCENSNNSLPPYENELFVKVFSNDGTNLLDTTNPKSYFTDSIKVIYQMYDGCVSEVHLSILDPFDVSTHTYANVLYESSPTLCIATNIYCHNHYDTLLNNGTYYEKCSKYDAYDYDNWGRDNSVFYIQWDKNDIDTIESFYRRSKIAYDREYPYKVLLNGKEVDMTQHAATVKIVKYR